ncbi:MAG: NAD(P)-dependent oxidoreductase [Alphaproteobacteria bacterium]|nr:NAD(P)-dependent oxidoreductase [Alphaproteobacteria bacterium]
MKVGFIGVGSMGGPMCRNIIRKSNHEITVFDLNAAAVKACTDIGGKAAGSVAELAAGADVVMTSLPMPRDVEAVALGPGGIAENARKGTVYFDLSTNSPATVRRIAEQLKARGITMLDAPVSGGVVGAENATIAIMVGGDKATFEAQLPLLKSFSANVIHMGELGTGTVAKLVNNMVAFCNMAAGAEGLMLGAAAGIDVRKLDEVIRNSSGNSNAYRSMAERVMKGDFKAAFALNLAYKDTHLALELADELSVPTPLAAQVHNLMRMARGLGLGTSDTSSIMRVYETTLKREVRAASGD